MASTDQTPSVEELRRNLRIATIEAQRAVTAAQYPAPIPSAPAPTPAPAFEPSLPHNELEAIEARLTALAPDESADFLSADAVRRLIRDRRTAETGSRSAPTTGAAGTTTAATNGTENAAAAKATAEAKVVATKEAQEEGADSLSDTDRKLNEAYLNKVGKNAFRYSLWTLAAGVVIMFLFEIHVGEPHVPLVLRFDIVGSVHRLLTNDNHAFIAACAAMLIWGVLALLSVAKRKSGGLVRVLLGKDGRFSTSYFQAWVWTLVLAWAFLLLAALNGPHMLDGNASGDLGINPDYLLLLGGPFAAVVVALQIDKSKVASGELQKEPASSTTVSDLFSNDAGRTDLVDTQYLLFNIVALAVFLGLLVVNPTQLPDLPDELVLLTSGAALGYVARKAVQGNAPSILSVVPTDGTTVPTAGGRVLINGLNFVPSGSEGADSLARVRIKFGDTVVGPTPAPDVDPRQAPAAVPGVVPVPTLKWDGISSSAITADVPIFDDDKTERTVNVSVVTSPGIETNAVQLRIFSPILQAQVAQTVSGEIATVTIALGGSKPAGTPVRVVVGTLTFDRFVDAQGQVKVDVPKASAENATIIVRCLGAAYTSQLVFV